MSSLPLLELPSLNLAEALSFDLSTLGDGYKWLDVVSASSTNNINDTNDDVDEQEPFSPLCLADQLQLDSHVEFISHFECEESSGFGADLLWGYVVEQKGSGSSSSSSANAGKSSSSAKDASSSGAGGNYHQQQRAKQQQQAKQPRAGGGASSATRGELGSNAQGQQIINLTAEDYETDWYAILCIEDEGCSESELKGAFRRRCLETHPDKRQGSDEEFKKVQRAFEVLSNPDARRQFDSARTFDDSIPPSDMVFDDKPKEFFDMFKAVFSRNARWSTVPVTVNIGDENTPVADVRRFYDFWLGFRSWRDFSHIAELEEIHEGMPRYEKRFYQQENERILNGHKKQEAKRIRNLVDRAMAADPRLRSDARRQEEERLAVLEARKETQRQAALERERQEQEAKDKEIAAEREAKEAVARARQEWKDAKASVVNKMKERNLLDEESQSKELVDTKVNLPNIDWIFSKVPQGKNPSAVATRILQVEDEERDLAPNFNKVVLALEKSLGVTRYGEPIVNSKQDASSGAAASTSSGKSKTGQDDKKKDASSLSSVNVSWSEEDIVNLTKAIAKYPGGSVDRWRKIAVMLREKFTEEQILAKTKQLENTSKSSGATAALTQVTSAAAAGTTPTTTTTTTTTTAAAGVGSGGGDISSGAAGGEEDWTAKQQSQLEEGLRALKDYKEKDKWIKVGQYVTGKTAKQCFERYKHLVAVASKAKK